MVQAYWQIRYLIVEHEQEGKERAEYGKALLKELSGRLSGEYGKGFDVTNLRNILILFNKIMHEELNWLWQNQNAVTVGKKQRKGIVHLWTN